MKNSYTVIAGEVKNSLIICSFIWRNWVVGETGYTHPHIQTKPPLFKFMLIIIKCKVHYNVHTTLYTGVN